tara:strand:- start:607 stop:1089 length:483 start_codon:yes stop_codon:yes gene_type:complete
VRGRGLLKDRLRFVILGQSGAHDVDASRIQGTCQAPTHAVPTKDDARVQVDWQTHETNAASEPRKKKSSEARFGDEIFVVGQINMGAFNKILIQTCVIVMPLLRNALVITALLPSLADASAFPKTGALVSAAHRTVHNAHDQRRIREVEFGVREKDRVRV